MATFVCRLSLWFAHYHFRNSVFEGCDLFPTPEQHLSQPSIMAKRRHTGPQCPFPPLALQSVKRARVQKLHYQQVEKIYLKLESQ